LLIRKIKIEESLAYKYPEIAKLWHSTLNGIMNPSLIKPKSHFKAWWICPIHGEFEQVVSSKTNGIGCPYCSGNKAHKLNSLATTHPEVSKLWHPTLNGNLTPNDVVAGSEKLAWWTCDIHGEYEQMVNSKANRGFNCPYCSNQKVHLLNSLATTHPEIAKEWHPTLNNDLKPSDVIAGSAKRVWLNCPIHGEYKQLVYSKTFGSGCLYCSGNKVHPKTSLAIIHPEIAKLWHPTLNKELTPEDFTAGSNAIIWWVCPIHGEYEQGIKLKTRGDGCPYCAGKKVNETNCLATTHPQIAKLWHPTLNGEFSPYNTTFGSNLNVWWSCRYHKEYKQRINDKTLGNQSCPSCRINKGESKVLEILKSKDIRNIPQYTFPDCRYKKVLRFDFAVISNKDLQFLLEYDGEGHFFEVDYWKDSYEQTIIRDKIKNEYCKINKIPLLRIPYWKFSDMELIIEMVLKQVEKPNFLQYVTRLTETLLLTKIKIPA